MTSSRTGATASTRRAYTPTLTNAGAKAVTADLVFTIPTYGAYAASDHAAVAGANATWTITVKPGVTERRHRTAPERRARCSLRFVGESPPCVS